MLVQPLAHLLDGLVDLGHAPGGEDERVLPCGHRVDLGGDFEVGEPAAEFGAVAGEQFVFAVVHDRGRQAAEVGVDQADLRVGEVQGRVLQPGSAGVSGRWRR